MTELVDASIAALRANHDQLAASAGLSASEAAGMSLSEIAAAKFDRDTNSSDN